MNEKKLQWLIACVALFIGVAYFLWLCLVFMRFQQTDTYVRKVIGDHFADLKPEDITGEVRND